MSWERQIGPGEFAKDGASWLGDSFPTLWHGKLFFFFSVDIVLELLFFFKVFKDVCFFLFLVVVMFLSDVSKDVILQLL